MRGSTHHDTCAVLTRPLVEGGRRLCDCAPFSVVGYEGGAAPDDHALCWANAAIRTPHGILNAQRFQRPPCSLEDWEESVADGGATELEVPIPISRPGPYFVLGMWNILHDKSPYREGLSLISMGWAVGSKRTWHAIRSYEALCAYLTSLHAGPYVLTHSPLPAGFPPKPAT